jgi:hypothetical protein
LVQVGVALFKGQPNALFPFSEMNKDQRYYVEQIVLKCLRQYEILQRAEGNHVVMQMGGGCILYTEPMNFPPRHHYHHDHHNASQRLLPCSTSALAAAPHTNHCVIAIFFFQQNTQEEEG